LLFVLPFDFFKHWHVMPHPSSLFRFAVPRALGASLAITCSLRQPAIISFFPDASFACRVPLCRSPFSTRVPGGAYNPDSK
jgi:hypothetical protein